MKIPLLPAEDDDKWVRSYCVRTAWTGVVDDTGSHGAFVQNHSPYIPASALVSRYVGEAANGNFEARRGRRRLRRIQFY